jgi:hypothetical protein
MGDGFRAKPQETPTNLKHTAPGGALHWLPPSEQGPVGWLLIVKKKKLVACLFNVW